MFKINSFKLFCALIFTLTLFSCSSPGIKTPSSITNFSGDESFFSDDKMLNVIKIDNENVLEYKDLENEYFISSGDKLNITVWGLPDAFPPINVSSKDNPLSTRTVNADGTIFFPFVGTVSLSGLSLNQARKLITEKLSLTFIDPQVDITIVEFNEARTAYVMGEIISPTSFKVGIEPISLMDAIGKSKGLNPSTSKASDVYIMRNLNGDPEIYKLDISTSDKFLVAQNFYINAGDVIFIGPSDITSWNRVISQLFPFSSFLNQLDLIANRSSN